MFVNNMGIYTNCKIEIKDVLTSGKRNIPSAIFAEMPIALKGSTKFFNNTGGGITIVERRIDMYGNVEFVNNCSPYDGGGIRLEDESFVSDAILCALILPTIFCKSMGQLSLLDTHNRMLRLIG